MFLNEQYHKKKNSLNLSRFYYLSKGFNSNLAFQVYLDLCLFRGWKNVRIIYNDFIELYLIMAFNPKKKKKFSLELFFPIDIDSKIIPDISKQISLILYKCNLYDICNTVNFAFVDPDSTVSYYYITSNFHKIVGPYID